MRRLVEDIDGVLDPRAADGSAVVQPEGRAGGFGGWVHRPRLSAEDRRAAMDALMLRPTPGSLRRFAVLMGLSVVVATLGLLENSTAVVVGAMVIAPLMAPIMGLAASLVMGWGRRLLSGSVVVGLSVIGAVAMAWAIAKFLPAASSSLPAEVVSRSSPDVRDLLVALAAGAAGAYATVRKDISGALPGVAVAVALVPPLATVGVLLGRDQPDLAGGAGLLFATNLFGIVLAAAVVFMLTGFVPTHRFRVGRRAIYATFAVILVPTVAVGAVLTERFVETVDRARELRVATQVVLGWLGPTAELNRITLSGATVQVNVTSEAAPPQLQTLTDALREALGHQMTVDLRWTPVSDGATQPTNPALALDQVRPVIERWLSGQSLSLDGLSYDSGTLVVQTSGSQPPRNGEELTELIGDRFGVRPLVSLAWTRTSEGDAANGENTAADTARAVTARWVQAHPGTSVLGVDQSGFYVTVTIIASVQPVVEDLQVELRAALPQMTVTIQWIPSSVLVQSTPSSAPSSTPPPGPGRSGSVQPSAPSR